MKNQKGFAKMVLIGIAVILIALSSYLAWSKKTNEQATISNSPDWQTYTNEKYGYSIMYPSLMGIHDRWEKGTPVDIGGIHNVTIDVWSPSYYSCETASDSVHASISQIDFIERNATSDYSGMNSYTPATEYCTKHNNSIYVVTIFGTTDILVKEQILSTFKFTESATQQNLTEEIVLSLFADDLIKGGCHSEREMAMADEYVSCQITISEEEDSWEVMFTYTGLHDDSISGERIQAPVMYENGKWFKGEVTETWKCAGGRGHQNFSTESCL